MAASSTGQKKIRVWGKEQDVGNGQRRPNWALLPPAAFPKSQETDSKAHLEIPQLPPRQCRLGRRKQEAGAKVSSRHSGFGGPDLHEGLTFQKVVQESVLKAIRLTMLQTHRCQGSDRRMVTPGLGSLAGEGWSNWGSSWSRPTPRRSWSCQSCPGGWTQQSGENNSGNKLREVAQLINPSPK